MSADPDAKYFPFFENTTLVIGWEWPVKVLMSSPFDIFHILIVQSIDPDAKYYPFGEKTTLITGDEWPMRVFMRSKLDTLL